MLKIVIVLEKKLEGLKGREGFLHLHVKSSENLFTMWKAKMIFFWWYDFYFQKGYETVADRLYKSFFWSVGCNCIEKFELILCFLRLWFDKMQCYKMWLVNLWWSVQRHYKHCRYKGKTNPFITRYEPRRYINCFSTYLVFSVTLKKFMAHK